MCAQLINIVTRLKTAWDSLAQGREHKEQFSSLNEPWTAVLQLHCYQKHRASHLPRVPSIYHPSSSSHSYQSIHTFTIFFPFLMHLQINISDFHCAFGKRCCHYLCILEILHIKSLQNTQYIWWEQSSEKNGILFALFMINCSMHTCMQQVVLMFTVDCSYKATRSHSFYLSFLK